MFIHQLITATAQLGADGKAITMRSITVIPKTDADGSWKIEQGTTGAEGDVVPRNDAAVDVLQDTSVHSIPMPKKGIFVPNRLYVTVTNCKLLIGYEGGI